MRRSFSRQKDHRESMLRNLATSLILYEKVDTTVPKAKELRSYIDHILATNKKASLNAIRNLSKVFFDKNAVKKIVEVLIPRYSKRTSGFTSAFGLKNRFGDNAMMMRVELVDKKVFVNEPTQKSDPDAKSATAEIEPVKSKGSKKEHKNG